MKRPWKRCVWTVSRHRDAVVFAASCCWGGAKYTMQRGWTATLGLGLWSIHLAYRWG